LSMGTEVPPTFWDAGADYIRMTYTGGGEDAYRVAERYRAAVVELAAKADPTARPEEWAWLGYKGTKVSTASWGLGEQGALLQVSGALSHDAVLLDLPRTGVPRLDLQVTTWNEPSASDIPRRVSRETLAARTGARGRPWKIALIDGFGEGDTCYIGSRQSACFIRVYDKAKESADEAYAGAVRYEAEFKGREAEAAYAEMVQAGPAACSCAAGIVRGVLAHRGASLPEWVQVPSKARHLAIRETPSVDRSCAWLQGQVSPTVRRLMDEGVSYELLHRILFGKPHSQEICQFAENVLY